MFTMFMTGDENLFVKGRIKRGDDEARSARWEGFFSVFTAPINKK
jgi:hypothetical protein